jgi:hypothetical protein
MLAETIEHLMEERSSKVVIKGRIPKLNSNKMTTQMRMLQLKNSLTNMLSQSQVSSNNMFESWGNIDQKIHTKMQNENADESHNEQ